METLFFIIFYLIGCLLCFGRIKAQFYEIEEKYIFLLPPENPQIIFVIFHSSFSWIGLLAGVVSKLMKKEKYWFKWSYKPLYDQWEANQNK